MSAPVADNLPLPPAPPERCGLLSFDPPWHFQTRAPTDNHGRAPQAHYPTMDLASIKAIPVREMALPDAWVMLWITGPLMAQGVHNILFKAWGVKPSSLGFVWIKLWNKFDTDQLFRTPLLENDLVQGLGFTTRQNAEYVVFGRIGAPPRGRADIRQVIISPRREHSRKPEEFYRRAEHYCTGPRLDGFGGKPRPGWHHWGYGHRAGEAAPYLGGDE